MAADTERERYQTDEQRAACDAWWDQWLLKSGVTFDGKTRVAACDAWHARDAEVEDLRQQIKMLSRPDLPNHPGACDCHACNDAIQREAELERIAQFLFQLLDDIDTAEDAAKGNDKAFRIMVHHLHLRRFEVATTDGYTVAWKTA